jgi:hypothetical protein
MGLIDVDKLKKREYDAEKSGVNAQLSASNRPQNAPKTGSKRGAENQKYAGIEAPNAKSAENPEKCTSREKHNGASYRSVNGIDTSPALAADSRHLEGLV